MMDKIELRDKWFKILIAFLFISIIVGLRRGFLGVLQESTIIPVWYYYMNISLNLIGLLALFWMYNFKKNGVICFIGSLLIDFLIQLFILKTSNEASMFFIFMSILFIGVKVIPNWKKYD